MFKKESNVKIDGIIKQFLCNVPIKNFIWNNIFENFTHEDQEILVKGTVNSSLVLNYPVKINYQRVFLKYIIVNLVKHHSGVHEDLFTAYGRLVTIPNKGECYKHYSIEDDSETVISLKENIHLISNGTTGLRTWEAALALSEWSLSNIETFQGNVVLELGSGVGLTGLTIAKECAPSCVYLTDCHPSVLDVLCDNIKLNMDKCAPSNTCNTASDDYSDRLKQLQERCLYHNLGQSNVFVVNLPWEDVNKESCSKLGTINKVIAADVVYDYELFDPLISALTCFASFCSVDEFIFCCTERNKNTLEEFLKRMDKACFAVEELQIPPQRNFIWPTDTPVRLFRFTLKSS